MKLKKLLCIALSILLMGSVLSASVFSLNLFGGEEANPKVEQGDEESNLHVTKSVVGKDGEYYLTLEAYATGYSKKVEYASPVDLILLMDTSLSMATSYLKVDYEDLQPEFANLYKYGKQRYSMRYYKGHWQYYYYWDLVGLVGDWFEIDAKSKGDVTITKFDALKLSAYNFLDGLDEDAKEKGLVHRVSVVSYGSVAKEESQFLNISNPENKKLLKNIIRGLEPFGVSRTDLGLALSDAILANAAREDCNKVVLMFSDGAPTELLVPGVSVADETIRVAKALKAKDTMIFTVGTHLSPESKFFLSCVSSEYPDATSVKNPGAKDIEKYSFEINSVDMLSPVLDDGILSKVSVVYAQADQFAVLTDALAPYFKFMDVGEDGELKWYSVYTMSNTNFGWIFDRFQYGNVDVSVDSENKTLSVTGYNYVGRENMVRTDALGFKYGKKLVVTVRISPEYDRDLLPIGFRWEDGSNFCKTNDNLTIVTGENETLFEMDDSPVVAVQGYTVTFLIEDTERAKFSANDGTELSRVFVEGEEFPKDELPPMVEATAYGYSFDRWIESDAVPGEDGLRPEVEKWPGKILQDYSYTALLKYDVAPELMYFYKINYWKQDVDGEFDLIYSEMPCNFEGVEVKADPFSAEDEVNYGVTESDGFRLSEDSNMIGLVIRPYLDPDEGVVQTVLNVYYVRLEVTVTFNLLPDENGKYNGMIGNAGEGYDVHPIVFTYLYGQTPKNPPMTKADPYYHFSGWKVLDGDNYVDAIPPEEVTENKEIYGWFEKNPSYYIVEYYLQGSDGEWTKQISFTVDSFENEYVYADQLTECENPAVTKFIEDNADYVAELYYDEEKSNLSGTVTPIGSGNTLTLKMYYDLNKYDITYKCGEHGTFPDGSTEYTVTEFWGAPIPVPATPAPTDTAADEYFFFDYWADAEGNEVDFADMTISEAAEFTAIWYRVTTPIDPDTFVAVYRVLIYKENLDGTYTLVEGDEEIGQVPYRGKVGSEVSYEPEAVEHYHLNNEKSVLKGIVVMPEMKDGDTEPTILKLEVYYDLDTFDVTFDATDGTIGGQKTVTATVKYGGDFPEIPVPDELEGFDFGGWTDENGNVVETFPENVTEAHTYKAVWNPKTGDSSMTALWIMLAMVSAIGACIVVKSRRDRRATAR